jgi:hypothetical protein
MTKMGTTNSTLDFGPVSIRVWQFLYGPRNSFVKTGPPTTRMKFTIGIEEVCTALTADIDTSFKEIIVFPLERSFGTFMEDHLLFFGC